MIEEAAVASNERRAKKLRFASNERRAKKLRFASDERRAKKLRLRAMKRVRAVSLLAWLAVVLAPMPVHADGKAKPKPERVPASALPKPDDSQAPARVDPQLLQRAYDRAKAKRNVGIGLAAPGVALTLLGGVAVAFGLTDPNLLSRGGELIGGGIAGLAGLAIGIPGTYFWSTGQDDMDGATWRLRQLQPAR